MQSPNTAATSPEPWPPSASYRRAVAITLAIVYALNQLDRQIINILLEPIKREFTLTDAQAGLLSGLAFALFYCTLGIPLARIADRGHRVGMISIAVALWSGMTALCGMASSFVQLLLARVGVGIGEAGCTPAAHSLLADYYGAKERSRGLAIYALGTPLGSSLGLVIGGVVNQFYGWRAAFLAVGLPGVLMAAATWWLVKEPRTMGVPSVAAPPTAPLRDVLRKLFATKSFIHICLAVTIFAISAYSVSVWGAAYQIRMFNAPTAILGLASAAIGLIAGIGGVWIGGTLGEKLGAKDARWLVWIPAIALIAGLPFGALSLMAPSWPLSLAAFTFPLATLYVYSGPVFGLMQTLMPPNMRAVAVSVFLLVTNLIGLGLGPVITGMLSDFFGAASGSAQGLRYALGATGIFTVWGAIHFVLAARTLREDLAATLEETVIAPIRSGFA